MTEAAFYACLAVLMYAYAGYPALIGLWAWLRPREVLRGALFPRVAIIVVAYHEETSIDAKLRTCLAQDYPADLLRVIVATDGSTDRTNALVERCADRRVRLLAFAA